MAKSVQNMCACKTGHYIIPTLNKIPIPLRSLILEHILVLMKHRYRKKTAFLKLQCSKKSPEEEIALLENENDRRICQNAYDYLIACENSSYREYILKRD